jgi:tetratricopeptide (TPR) repeat protein
VKATKLNSRSANAFNSLGVILAHLERNVEALASFDAALKLEPNHVQALSNRCNSLNKLRRFDDAIDSSNRALAINPNYSEAYIPRGAALFGCKRYMEALEKPPLKLVKPSSVTGPQPSRTLGNHGRSLWDRVMIDYEINDVGGNEMLLQACQALDRAEAVGRPPQPVGWQP